MVCDSESTEYINYCIVSCSAISTLCSGFIIYLSFQKAFDKLTLRLLYHLAINDIIRSTCLILCIFCTDDLLRKIISPFYLYSLLSNLFWTLYLSTTLYLSIVKGKTNQEDYYKYWLIVNYIFLLGLCFVPFTTNSYGLSNNICTLKTNQSSFKWKIIVNYAYIPLITAVDIILYVLIYNYLKKLDTNATKGIILERGFIYIILIIAQYIPFVVISIFILEDKSCLSNLLQGCMHIMISLHGLCNFIPILLKSQGRKVIRKLVFLQAKHELTSLESSLDILNSRDMESNE